MQAAVLALLVSILGCGLPAATSSAIFYVTGFGNDSNTCLSVRAACLTVQAAIEKATPGSTIRIGVGTYFERAGEIVVDKNLVLRGEGRDVTFLAVTGNPERILSIHSHEVRLQDLTVNGTPGEFSSGIEIDGASIVVLEGVAVQNNPGVGIKIHAGSTVTVTGSLISNNNYNTDTGTGIYNEGGLQVLNTTIRQNNLAGIENFAVAAVDGSTLDENGVGVMNNTGRDVDPGFTGILSVTHSIFSNNNFGIINDGGGRVSISSTSFTRGFGVANSGGFVRIQNSVLSDGSDTNQVGLLLNGDPANPAVDEISGTAILRIPIGVWLQSDKSQATLENVTISSGIGEGIIVDGGAVTLSYSTVAHNEGGVGLLHGGTLTANNSIIALNSPLTNCDGAGMSFGGNRAFACDDTLTAATLGLAALATEAGTELHPLLAGSGAIDAAAGVCPAQDQRGYTRPYGAACDVGAYEFGAGAHLEAPTPGVVEILPSETPTASVTPTPGASMLVLIQNANCRRGPGSVYPVLTSFLQGQSLQVDGRSATAPLWWQVALPNSSQHCWVSDAAGTPSGDSNSLPVIPAPPTPIPTEKPGGAGGSDADKDGYTSDVDCDDKNAKVHPGATETAKDGVDSNCDGKDDS